MPLWLFMVGRCIMPQSKKRENPYSVQVEIPYFEIIKQLLLVLVPTIVGILIRKFLPKVANVIRKAMRPLAIFIIIFFLTVGIFIHLEIFRVIFVYWYLIPVSGLLPWFGYLLGFLGARILRLNRRDSLTISIETGIQNSGIAIMILKYSIEKPEGEIGVILCILISLLTPLPLYLFGIVHCIKRRVCCKKCCKQKTNENEPKGGDNSEQNVPSNPSNTKSSEIDNGNEELDKDHSGLITASESPRPSIESANYPFMAEIAKLEMEDKQNEENETK